MQKSEKKKLWTGILVGVIVGCVTLAAAGAVFLLFAIFGGPPKVIKDIDKYEEALALCSGQRTGFIVFPEQIPEALEEEDFYFSYQDSFGSPTVEAFLQCTYSEEAYRAEVERLENTYKQYGSKISTLLKEEGERYPYPAYIAVDGLWSGYEYALLTGERQITYIYIAYRDANTLKKVEAEYLPEGFHENQTNLGPDHDGYCIYLEKTDYYENGEIMGWSCDYTRDAKVEVSEHKWVKVGYNSFYVDVVLDEQDREIIRECAYSYYESRHDSMYGFPEAIVYEELAGYEYKDLELINGETQAVVTYLDEKGEEKRFVYDIPEVD